MVMTLKLTHHRPSNNILVIAGYEGGFTAVHVVPRPATGKRKLNLDVARTIYLSQPHTQPVLSLDALPDGSAYFTSSADAVIAAHRVPELPLDTLVSDDGTEESATDVVHPQTVNGDDGSAASKHAVMTSDEDSEALATAKDTKPSSSASSRDSSPPALSFSKTRPAPAAPSHSSVPQASGLSTLLSAAPPQSIPTSASEIPAVVTVQAPYKISNTKHAGQQSLRVRSDGRLFITGGWDSRVRIYSTRTLKEMAVLKWHKEGVYATGFGEIINVEDSEKSVEQPVDGASQSVIRRETGLKKLQRQREEVIRGKHWAVAGAKDGRVSLWEVF
jgi:WD40 repeat protein